MRLYSVAVAALAIDAPLKWLDNLLSHHTIPNVLAERRGVARKIPHPALIHLALARELHIALKLSTRDALALATALLALDDDAVHESGHVRVSFNRLALERDVAARLRTALETAPMPRRGPTPKRGIEAVRK